MFWKYYDSSFATNLLPPIKYVGFKVILIATYIGSNESLTKFLLGPDSVVVGTSLT